MSIQKVLSLHSLWLLGDPRGIRADLSDADLSEANLSRANLSDANLSRAERSVRENSKAPACPVEARLSNISMDVNRRGCFRWTSFRRWVWRCSLGSV